MQENLFDAEGQGRGRPPAAAVRLMILFSAARGEVSFTWLEEGQTVPFAQGILAPFEF